MRKTPPIDNVEAADVVEAVERHAGPLPTRQKRRRYRLIFTGLAIAAVFFAFMTLAWQNPMPLGSQGWWRIAEMRMTQLIVIALVSFCQAIATIAFQTVTYNRILTPSIMGFESLYTLVNTSAVFFFGAAGASMVMGGWQYLGTVAVMIGFAAVLYGWLFAGKRGNLQVMLLVGIILGGALGAVSTFMQRLMTPSDFDVLLARLIGSISNADRSEIPWALALAVIFGVLLWMRSTKLNLIGLGRETAINLGGNHKRESIIALILIAGLMAVSTSLVGPMMFLGFLIAMLTYQLADTYDHRLLFPMGWLIGFVILTGSYFILKNVFYAEGSVGIIIEVVGGSFFLYYIMRKGRL